MTAADVYIQTPPLLTAEEAMLVLRIGRSNVYESANRFLATGGPMNTNRTTTPKSSRRQLPTFGRGSRCCG